MIRHYRRINKFHWTTFLSVTANEKVRTAYVQRERLPVNSHLSYVRFTGATRIEAVRESEVITVPPLFVIQSKCHKANAENCEQNNYVRLQKVE